MRADAGIVYVPGRPYVFVAMGTFLREDAAPSGALEKLARLSYEYFSRRDYGERDTDDRFVRLRATGSGLRAAGYSNCRTRSLKPVASSQREQAGHRYTRCRPGMKESAARES